MEPDKEVIMKEKKEYIKPRLSYDELAMALYKANQDLNERNKQLVEMEQSRTEMFANISHDLRSPITAIRSSVEYLQSLDNIPPQELGICLNLMNQRIRNLESLINDIFLMTKLDQPLVSVPMETMDMGMFLEEFYYQTEADIKFQKRKLQLQVPEDLRVDAKVNSEQIQRVLDNLFNNALKYSYDDSEIILGARKTDHCIEIWVKDNGVGISKENLQKIFDRTFTVSDARTPKGVECGAGLGLSIVKLIIEKHGGKVWCESELGEGSCFTFSLPII